MPYLGRLMVRDRQWEGQQQHFPTVWKTTGGRLITRGSINVLSDCSDCGRTGDLNLNSINVLALFTATVHVFLQRWTWGSSTRVDLLIMTHLLLRSSAIAVYIVSSGTSQQLWDVASAPVRKHESTHRRPRWPTKETHGLQHTQINLTLKPSPQSLKTSHHGCTSD